MQESVSMTRAALFLAACVLAVSPANASAYLSEEQARMSGLCVLRVLCGGVFLCVLRALRNAFESRRKEV